VNDKVIWEANGRGTEVSGRGTAGKGLVDGMQMVKQDKVNGKETDG